MQENISVLIASIVAVVIIVLFPIYNIAVRQDSIANNMVVRATTSFVDDVRNKGYIDKETYGKYLNELDKSGNTYDVEMEVYKPILLETSEGSDEYEEKYEIDYTTDILSNMDDKSLNKNTGSIKNKNSYYLEEDYKFYVRVKNNNITQAQILLGRLLGGKQNERIIVNYGGMVYSNEWALGEGADNVESSISISRPLDINEEEYKYEYITTSYDPSTEQVEDIYSIAVRMGDDIADSGIIKFRLTYKSVQFKDDAGNILTDEDDIENHISKYIELFSLDGISIRADDIIVETKELKQENDYYNAEFLITYKDIIYDYEEHPYVNTKARVKVGSAYSGAGKIGELTSTEFVIFYGTLSKPEITLASTTPINVITNSNVPLAEGETSKELTFNIKASIDSSVAKIKKILYKMERNDELYEESEIEVESSNNVEYSMIKTLEGGKYELEIQAVDSRGYVSDVHKYEFIIGDTITERAIISPVVQGRDNEINMPYKSGWSPIDYTFKVYFPNRSDKESNHDYYSIVLWKRGSGGSVDRILEAPDYNPASINSRDYYGPLRYRDDFRDDRISCKGVQ